MTSLRGRRGLVVLTIGLVVLAAFVPAVAASLPPISLTALWLIVPVALVTRIRHDVVRCLEQPSSLLTLVSPRPPPPRSAFA